MSRSFSSALLMIRSSSEGTSGFRRTGVGGTIQNRVEDHAEVSPRNGSVPVHISYSTAPNENRSVRASSSFPRTCSGDMYATVPSALPGLVRCSSGPDGRGAQGNAFRLEETFASPKSRIFA